MGTEKYFQHMVKEPPDTIYMQKERSWTPTSYYVTKSKWIKANVGKDLEKLEPLC